MTPSSRPASPPQQENQQKTERGQVVARSREKEPSLEEMLQMLRATFKGRLAPPLGGFVYRFTIFLPMLSEGKEVFTQHHRYVLGDLFHACMRGYTEASSEGHPPWYGSRAPPRARRPGLQPTSGG